MISQLLLQTFISSPFQQKRKTLEKYSEINRTVNGDTQSVITFQELENQVDSLNQKLIPFHLIIKERKQPLGTINLTIIHPLEMIKNRRISILCSCKHEFRHNCNASHQIFSPRIRGYKQVD